MLVAILDVVSGGGGTPRVLRVGFTSDCMNLGVKTLDECSLVNEVVRGGHVLVNASVNGSRLKEDIGSFSRLAARNGVKPQIILSTYVSTSGRLLGYFLVGIDGRLSRVRPDALYSACEKAKSRGVSFIQNGIYRRTDTGSQIACYPDKPFYVIKQTVKNKPKSAIEPQVNMLKNKETLKPASTSKYTAEQMKELTYAKENGVNPIIIANPKLSAEQMRTLWVAKKNRVCVEYFANPKFTADQMTFLSDRLIDKRVFNDCKLMINPKYSVNQMTELYLGAISGADITEYANPKFTSKQMRVLRQEQESKLWVSDNFGLIQDKKVEAETIKKLYSKV